MELLNYLKPHSNSCDIENIKKVKVERDLWIQRKNTQHLWERFEGLPKLERKIDLDFSLPQIKIGKKEDLSSEGYQTLLDLCKDLIPWKKGPFDIFGIEIDSEWRSDFKWDRLQTAIGNLQGKRVLDIGCNNGYFMFKMAQFKPELILGIDPVVHCLLQFRLIQRYANLPNTFFELLGVEHVKNFKNFFDEIFYMGIIYHHKNPIQQLIEIREALRPNGRIIFETIGIPGEGPFALFPEDRYAKMRNIWFIPTLSCCVNWLKKAKYKNIEVISSTNLTFDEQRNTPWNPPPHQTLKDFLDPQNLSKTIEGHPAPRRFSIIASKK
mgnify:FL=1